MKSPKKFMSACLFSLTDRNFFHEDGTMRKSCKSDLVKQFENEVCPVLSLPDFDTSLTTYIRDGMALVPAFYDLEHLCMGSHFGTTISFSRRDGVFLRHTGQMHLLLYVLLQSMMSTVCSSW
jgi:hypothetical protein